MASILDYVTGLSLRHKLLALVLLPLLLLTGTVIYLSAQWTTTHTYKQLYTKVNTDLRVTHDIFNRIQRDRQLALTSLADSSSFLRKLSEEDNQGVLTLLKKLTSNGDFDFVNLLSADASARLETDGWAAHEMADSPLTDFIFESAIAQTPVDAATGIEIYPEKLWKAENAQLAGKVEFPLIDTPRAAPTDRVAEHRAMVIRVLQRIRNADGDAVGVLEGGLLLNRNYSFVDEIRDLVYGPGSLAKGSRGTVTVFLDDVRITTNVPGSDDARALGTRVSVEVRNAVLNNGETWINRAFVVNDWYISAYEPIVDVYGERVGMLYAGYLEAPFKQDLYRGILATAAVVLGGSLLAAIVAILGAKSIFKPVESIARVVRATEAGQSKRIGDLKVRDEIGELGRQFDSMLDSLEKNRAQITANAVELEQKVQVRTTELEQKNISLQESIVLLHEAQNKLATAERLAAVGQLTAGVAHEINNPTAVILGNMDILIEELGDQRDGVQTEIDLIIEQVYRIRSITDRLLQYSRPTTSAPLGEDEPNSYAALHAEGAQENISPHTHVPVDVNKTIESSLLLVKQELAAKNISLVLQLNDVANVSIDRQELQQVIVNLVLNASQAVKFNGKISIRTNETDHEQIRIDVQDNGVGISSDNTHQVFDPFFTHGKEGGTGLGLSVSYGIVQRYGGEIEVASTESVGSTFSILLPAVEISPEFKTDNTHRIEQQHELEFS